MGHLEKSQRRPSRPPHVMQKAATGGLRGNNGQSGRRRDCELWDLWAPAIEGAQNSGQSWLGCGLWSEGGKGHCVQSSDPFPAPSAPRQSPHARPHGPQCPFCPLLDGHGHGPCAFWGGREPSLSNISRSPLSPQAQTGLKGKRSVASGDLCIGRQPGVPQLKQSLLIALHPPAAAALLFPLSVGRLNKGCHSRA